MVVRGARTSAWTKVFRLQGRVGAGAGSKQTRSCEAYT